MPPMLAGFPAFSRGVGKTRRQARDRAEDEGGTNQGRPAGGSEEGRGYAQAQPAARELAGGRQEGRVDASGQGRRVGSGRREERSEGRWQRRRARGARRGERCKGSGQVGGDSRGRREGERQEEEVALGAGAQPST